MASEIETSCNLSVMNKNKSIKILQWNVRGYNGVKRNEVDLICKEENAPIICLQETKFDRSFKPSKKGFQTFCKNRYSNGNAKGGVMIMVRDSISCKKITLKTKIQAIAVEISFPEELIICNVYQSPKEKLSKWDWENLIDQLGGKFMILGDFNAHSPAWGSKQRCEKGKMWENLIESFDFEILNDGKPTHVNCATKNFSNIDVTLTSNNLDKNYSWKVLDDLHSSDHLPILIDTNTELTETMRPRWKLNEADWGKYREILSENYYENYDLLTIDKHEEKIRLKILEAANKSIPRTTGNKASKFAPWWTEEIGREIKEKKKLYRKFKQTGNSTDFTKYMEKQKKINNKIKICKQQSWENFIGSASNSNMKDVYDKIRKINEKYKSNQLTAIKINNTLTTNKKEMVEKLAGKFNETTKINSYPEKTIKEITEKSTQKMKILDDTDENYNWNFTEQEMEQGMKGCKGSSPGPDDIPYEFIKHCNRETNTDILNFYNRIWVEKVYPATWKTSFAIPIQKPGKDPKTLII